MTKQENNQATKSSINITYVSTSKRISTITDSAERVYAFDYNSSNLLTSIKYKGSGSDPLTQVTFGYSGTRLASITDEDRKVSTYTYIDTNDTSKNLLETAKDIDGYTLTYTYTSLAAGQPARVASVSEKYGTTAGGNLTIEYAKNQTTFTDHNGSVQIMQFNNLGNTISVQDDQGHAQYARYAINDTTVPAEAAAAAETVETASSGKANQLNRVSKMQNTVGNILTDSSFEETSVWSASSGAVSTSLATGVAYIGNKSLKLDRTANGNAAGAYSSSFTAEAGQTYTFSAWVKTGEGSAYLALNDGTDNVTSEVLGKNQDWTRLQVSYTAEAQTTLTARILTEEAGTVYLDCAQVEKAPTASRYNLIENGDFRGTNGWSASTGRTTLTAAAPELSTDVYTMTGVYNSTNRLSQTVNVSGAEDDVFVLAGWAKGDSVPLDIDGTNSREFSIIATFYNNQTKVGESCIVRFNPYTDSSVNWQYAAAPILAPGDYTSITVELAYDYNMNTVYFDGIQLFKEPFGTSYTYDDNGNITAVKDIQGGNTEYTYDRDNNLSSVTLPDGAVLSYEYDSCNNVTFATTETGVTYKFGYNQLGQNTSVSIVIGDVTLTSTAEYSDTGRLLSTTDAAGNTTLYGYNPDTNVLEWVQYPNDTESTRTEYDCDNMYRVASAAVTTDTGLDLSVGYTYDNDLLTAIQTPSTTYNFAYGAFGLRSNIKVGTQTLASYDYTDDGNFYLEKLAYGNSDMVQYTYDDQGRVTAQTWENGDTVSYQYDNSGALATVTDSATGRKTTYYYDFTDRLMKYVESGTNYSHSVGYTYDTINNLTSLVETINGTAYTTSYTYDDDNRVSSITNGDSTQSVSYDAYGRVSGQVMKHNGISLLTEAFTYRDFVKEIKTTLEDGQETTQTVNYTSGQVEKLNISTNENGFNTVYEYTYDANGNIVSVKEGNKTTSYTYDSAGQLLRENNQAAGKTWVWTYDNAGNILSRTEYAYTTGELGNAVDTVTYTYGNSNWRDLLTSYDGQTITYDNIGNPLDDGTWEYTWEHGRQLASMTNGTTTIDYQYNSDGIRTKKVVTTTGDHVHSFQSNVVAPTCTENGYTLHSCSCGYIYQDAPVAATGHTFTTQVIDATCTEAGHIAHTCECGYSYEDGANGHNFTTLVVEPTETINGFTLHECDCGYSYESDPVASLGAATAANEEGVSDTKVYDYVYNGSSLVHLTITTNTYGEGQTVETLYFGNGTVTYNNEVYYYVTNLQGDVIAILNSNGAAVVEYTYDAWGNILTTTGSMANTLGAANPLTYRGYVYDDESLLYYLQSRYYNPEVGRFLNADILVSTGQGFLGCNMFAYCQNNPINLIDPGGTIPFSDGFFDENFRQIGEAIGRRYADTFARFFKKLGASLAGSCSITTEVGYGFGAKGKINGVSVEATAILLGDEWTKYLDGTSESQRSTSLTVQAEIIENVNLGLDLVYSAPIEVSKKTGLLDAPGGQFDAIIGAYIFNWGLGYKTVSTEDIELSYGFAAYLVMGGGVEFSINLSKFVEIWCAPPKPPEIT